MHNPFYGRHLLCTQDWALDELKTLLDLAIQFKQQPTQCKSLLKDKLFLLLFYSKSFRTTLSFVAAAHALGCQTHYMTPAMARFQSNNHPGEIIEDIAKVMSGYVHGVGIRAMEDELSYYGEGQQMLRDYATWANIPIINCANDSFHPAQGLADIMTWAEYFQPDYFDLSSLENKKLLVTWGNSELVRSYNSPQETLLLASRLGMHITVARPDGYDFDDQVYQAIKQHCTTHNTQFDIINHPTDGYRNAHVVYSRHWMSKQGYQDGKLQKSAEIEKSKQFPQWQTTSDKMALTDHAIFTHPMPVNHREVSNDVARGPRSVIYPIAHNRLHVQKAILAALLSDTLPVLH